MSQPLAPRQLYYRVFVILLGLTLLTVGVAFLELGPLNIIIALTIAVGKALLVLLFFMHLRYSNGLIWLVWGGGDLLVDAALDHHAERLPDAQLASRRRLVMHRRTPCWFRAEVLPPHSALILRVPPADRN